MATGVGVLEEIKSTLKEKEVHWKIPNYSNLGSDRDSPTFSFLGTRWHLEVIPRDIYDYSDQMGLHLHMDDDKDTISCNVLCTFGIKKNDGSLIDVHFFHHAFTTKKSRLTSRYFFQRSLLSKRESELMPSNELTIISNLKLLADPVKLTGYDLKSIHPNLLSLLSQYPTLDLNTLSENIKGLITDREFCDITLNVKDREFKAHRIILAARSPVFAAMFKHDTSEKQTGIVYISDCDTESFQVFIEYLYSGELENISFKNVFDLYKTADKYDVQELKTFCIVYMKHNLKVENVCDVVAFAEERDEKLLCGVVQEFFNRNVNQILATANWKILCKNNFNLANKLLIEMTSNVKVENNVKWVTS